MNPKIKNKSRRKENLVQVQIGNLVRIVVVKKRKQKYIKRSEKIVLRLNPHLQINQIPHQN